VFRRCCTLQKVWVRFQPWIEPLVKHRKGFRSQPPHHLQRGGVGLVSFLRLFTPGYPITFHCCCEKEIVNLMFVYYPVHLLPTASLANPLSPFPPPPPNNGKSKSSLRSSCSKQIYCSFNMSRYPMTNPLSIRLCLMAANRGTPPSTSQKSSPAQPNQSQPQSQPNRLS
jgi:hypothetical protein